MAADGGFATVAFVLIAVLSIAGLLSNGGAMLVIRRKKELRNSFGLLCLSHVVADFLTCTITLLWCAPCTFFIGSEWWTSWFAYVICLFGMVFFYVALYTHVVKAVNRLIAISRPSTYRLWVTSRWTWIVVLALWAVTFMQCCVYLFDGCHVWYDGKYYAWYYEETSCGDAIWTYYDQALDYSLLGLTLVCDAITMLNIRRHRRRVRSLQRTGRTAFVSTTTTAAASTSSLISYDHFWRDIRFFAQGVLFVIIYASMTISQHWIISTDTFYDENQAVMQLLFGTLVWIFSATIGGQAVDLFSELLSFFRLVIIVFNFGLR